METELVEKEFPKVSIIMPTYNSEKTIVQSIRSVLDQTYQNWELIIIDDNSTDNTRNLVKTMQEKRIRCLHSDENIGVAYARNLGIEKGKGKYFAFLDSDDLWTKDKLAKQLNFMMTNDILFSYTDYHTFVDTPYQIKSTRRFRSKVDYRKLLKGSQIGCLTVMIAKDVIKQFKMTDIRHEDYAFWLDILKGKNIEAYNVNEVLAYYRVGTQSLSSNKLKNITWQWNIYKKHLGLSIGKSLYYLIYYLINGISVRIRSL